MIWVDDSFPYNKYRDSKFETIYTNEYEDEDNNYCKILTQVDYSKKYNLYRVTTFKDGHWKSDVIFEGRKLDAIND